MTEKNRSRESHDLVDEWQDSKALVNNEYSAHDVSGKVHDLDGVRVNGNGTRHRGQVALVAVSGKLASLRTKTNDIGGNFESANSSVQHKHILKRF